VRYHRRSCCTRGTACRRHHSGRRVRRPMVDRGDFRTPSRSPRKRRISSARNSVSIGSGDVRNVDQRAFQLAAVKGFPTRAAHQGARHLRRHPFTGLSTSHICVRSNYADRAKPKNRPRCDSPKTPSTRFRIRRGRRRRSPQCRWCTHPDDCLDRSRTAASIPAKRILVAPICTVSPSTIRGRPEISAAKPVELIRKIAKLNVVAVLKFTCGGRSRHAGRDSGRRDGMTPCRRNSGRRGCSYDGRRRSYSGPGQRGWKAKMRVVPRLKFSIRQTSPKKWIIQQSGTSGKPVFVGRPAAANTHRHTSARPKAQKENGPSMGAKLGPSLSDDLTLGAPSVHRLVLGAG
jgi:hypothetical protein